MTVPIGDYLLSVFRDKIVMELIFQFVTAKNCESHTHSIMYTSPQFKTILSSLPHLNTLELKVIQQTLNAIINNKNPIKFISISGTWLDFSPVYPSVHGNIQTQENLYFPPVPINDLRFSLIRENLKHDSLSQLEPLNQKSANPQKLTRPLGIWKGKVRMSEDFDDLSSDILAEFGME
jgi:hypothetical protein